MAPAGRSYRIVKRADELGPDVPLPIAGKGPLQSQNQQ
jgi:hypothetical protein